MLDRLTSQFGDGILAASEEGDELRLSVRPEALLAVGRMLHDDPDLGFDYPADLAAAELEGQLQVVYRLYSVARRRYAVVRVAVSGPAPSVPSVSGIWAGADWFEREAFDLFGISFAGHPNLKRILLPEDWQGHPLRKGS